MLVNMRSIEDDKFLKTVGDAVRKRREGRGLTQRQLGQICGFHPTFIGGIERGERNLTLTKLRRLARAFRISPSDLLSDA